MAQINLIFNGVDNVSQIVSQINQQLQNTEKKAETLSQKLMGIHSALEIIGTAKSFVDGLAQSVSGLVGEYQHELEMETRLTTVMSARFGATSEMVQSVKDTLHAQESATGYSYEMLTNGAQELATYISSAETLKGLMPVLANMAKQAGVNSEEGMMSYATMLGKVMGGDMGGMSKRGYVFSDAEKEAFKLMTEEERLAFITETVTSSIGDQANALNALNPQSVQSISNALGDTRKALGKTLQPFLDFYQLVTMKWQISFLETINNAIQWIQKHINGVIIALGSLGVAVIALAGYFVILQKTAIISAVKAAAAWASANAPLLITIGIIIAIITAIALVLINSEKTFPAIVGFLWEIAGVAKAVGNNIKVAFLTGLEAVINGFLSLKTKVSDIFYTIVDKALSAAMKIAPIIDKAFPDFSTKLAGARATIAELKDENSNKPPFAFDNKGDYMDIGGTAEQYRAIGAMKGIQGSRDFQGAIDKLTSNFKNVVSGGVESGLINGMNETAIGDMTIGSNGALLTKNADEVDIAQDYKDLLSAKATEKFFFKQSNIRPEINIEMNGTNVTAEDVYDKVASALSETTNIMSESLYSSNGVA